MPKIYADLIIKGIKSINDVPDRIKEDVKKILIESGHEDLT
jgi:hypothetical protein